MASAISQNVLGLATATSPGLAQAGGYNILPAGIVFPYAGGTAPTGFLICDGQQLSKETYAALFAAIGDDYATQVDPTTGSAYAAPDEGFFRLPDYRGLFLRGVGTPSGLDAVTRGSLQGDKTKKNGLDATAASSSVSGTTNIGHSHGSSSVTGNTNSSGSHGHSQGSIVINGLVLGFNNSPPNNGGGSGVYSPPISYGSTSSNGRIDTTGSSNHSHGSSYTAGGQSLGTSNISLSSGSATAQAITVGDGDTETRPINKGVNYIIKA
jgi:microcystin-dependent protein